MDPRSLPPDWPYRSTARRLIAGPHRWWVIEEGPAHAPALLLLHGLGASGHSFRHMIPGLATQYRVIVPDLPGQGCTQTGARGRNGLAPTAQDLARLCETLGHAPVAVIGHSAGGAIALQMALDTPGLAVVGINAALGQFDGAAGVLFPRLAQGLAAMPFAASLATLWASPRLVDRLLDGTGSAMDADGRAQYRRLVQDADHVRGALDMMAQWRLGPLLDRLDSITSPVLLIAATDDRAVPPRVSEAAAARISRGSLLRIPGGHLVHEDRQTAQGLVATVQTWLADHVSDHTARQTEQASPKIS
jgi:magnesium chelatase accessory protein